MWWFECFISMVCGSWILRWIFKLLFWLFSNLMLLFRNIFELHRSIISETREKTFRWASGVKIATLKIERLKFLRCRLLVFTLSRLLNESHRASKRGADLTTDSKIPEPASTIARRKAKVKCPDFVRRFFLEYSRVHTYGVVYGEEEPSFEWMRPDNKWKFPYTLQLFEMEFFCCRQLVMCFVLLGLAGCSENEIQGKWHTCVVLMRGCWFWANSWRYQISLFQWQYLALDNVLYLRII